MMMIFQYNLLSEFIKKKKKKNVMVLTYTFKRTEKAG